MNTQRSKELAKEIVQRFHEMPFDFDRMRFELWLRREINAVMDEAYQKGRNEHPSSKLMGECVKFLADLNGQTWNFTNRDVITQNIRMRGQLLQQKVYDGIRSGYQDFADKYGSPIMQHLCKTWPIP